MAVRRESVEIDVRSNLARVAARDAAAVKLLANTLDSVSKAGGESERSSQRVASGLNRSSAAAGAATPKVSSLAAAQMRLAVAEKQAADAAGQVRVAEARLAEVRETGKAKASQIAAAEESLAKSRRNLESATTRATSASLAFAAANDEADRSVRRADTSINQLTGRLRVAADVASILGPALIPVGAVAIPALVGLTTQLTFGAAAAGTAILAFNGMGDAIGAMNDYALEPTTANAEKLETALAKLSPEAVKFARGIDTMRGQFAATRDAAADGLFPELTPALDDLDGLLSRVQPVLREIGSATGQMLADGLDSLDSERWQDFFDHLQSDARPILTDLGATIGGFAHGLSEVVMAFGPLTSDFSGWLRGLGTGFSNWAEGLDETEGFRDFIDYVRTNGPQVAATAGALGRALVEITTAAAPLGGPALAGVEAFAKAVAAVADSDLGTPIFTAIAGMALFNRAMALGRSSLNAFGQTRGNLALIGGSLDRIGASADRSSAGLSRLGRGAVGITAVGAAVGVLVAAVSELSNIDIDTENLDRNLQAVANGSGAESATKLLDQVNESLTFMEGWQNQAVYKVLDPLSIGFDTPMEKYEANVRSMDQALAQLVEGGNAEQAQQIFQRIAAMALKLPEGSSVAPWAAEGIMENFGAYETALSNAEGANNGYAGSADGAGEAAGRAALNVNQLAQEMRTQASEALAAFDAQTAWGEAVAAAREQARSGAKGIDEMTEAGRGNRTALSGLAGAWTNQSQAVKNNVGEYRQARKTFLEVAGAMGIGAAQARRMADRMLEMPRKVLISFEFRGMRRGIQDSLDLGAQLGLLNGFIASPRVVAKTAQAGAALGGIIGTLNVVDRRTATPTVIANTGAAAAALGGIIGQIGNINDKHVTITVHGVRTGVSVGGALGVPNALGGIYPARSYARGGIDQSNRHMPEFAGPGPTRIWREPETGGESYIPHRNDGRRPRAMSILEQTAALFGGEVSWGGQSRQQMERQGVQAAMRSGGTQRVMVQSKVSGFLTTSSGERVSLQEIESLIDQRIEDYAEADDDYGRSMAKRVPA